MMERIVDWAKRLGRKSIRITNYTMLDDAPDGEEFQNRCRAVWLEYHEDADWAQRKLNAGLILTPEGIDYMEREIFARREQKKHDDKLKKEMEDESPKSVPQRPEVVSELHPAAGGDTEDPGSSVPQGS